MNIIFAGFQFSPAVSIFISIILLGLLFDLIMLADAIIRKQWPIRGLSKLAWILWLTFPIFTGALVFTPIIAIIYFKKVVLAPKEDNLNPQQSAAAPMQLPETPNTPALLTPSAVVGVKEQPEE